MTRTRATIDPAVEAVRNQLHVRGLTQRMLAAHLGVTEKHVSQMFNGRVGVTLPMLRKMLAFVGLVLVVRRDGTPYGFDGRKP